MRFSEHAGGPGGIHASIVQLIGRQIVTGDIAPGDFLPEQGELSRQLGVSRTVVREATKVLTAKGLVESRPKRGTVVTPHSTWRLLDPDVLTWRTERGADVPFLRDVMEVREIIEPASARLAAARAEPGEIAEIEAALIEMGTDETGYLGADVVFHGTLVSASHNDYLIQMVAAFGPALRAVLVAAFGPAAGRESRAKAEWKTFLSFSLPLHRAVLEAVVARDPAGADEAMRNLIAESRRQILDAMNADRTPIGTR